MANNSDYTKNRTNLNNFVPEINKSNFTKYFNEALFNRFLTKDEYVYTDGVVGKLDPSNPNSSQLIEKTSFNQKYQLQPVVSGKVGTVDYYMAFQDFLTRLSRLGVNTDKFNEWGNSLQFNWIPPIDFDKLINYRDYYWVSDSFDDTPQYITVKNQCNWSNSRFIQVKKSASTVLPNSAIFSVDAINNKISLTGNVTTSFQVGQVVIIYNDAGIYSLYTMQSIAFNLASLKTDIVLVEPVDITSTNLVNTNLSITSKDIANNNLVVSGNYSALFTDGYVFATTGSPNKLVTYWETSASSYDSTTHKTTISVKNNIENTFNWTTISTAPVMLLAEAEASVICDNSSTDFITTWNDNDIGTLLWYKDYNVLVGQTHGATTLGSNLFSDSTVNFVSSGVEINDILRITLNGTTLEYPILSVNLNSLLLSSSSRFFNNINLSYSIVRRIPYSSIVHEIAPSSPSVNDYWVDSINDQLKQWDGSSWVSINNRISLLAKIINGLNSIDLKQQDDWSAQNHWIHRNELTNYTGKTRAQLPIIEFYPYLEFSNMSYATQKWQYRKDANSNYTEVDTVPSLFELSNISYSSIFSPEFGFQSSNTILLSEKYGNLTNSLIAGTKIVLDGFLENDGTYEVSNSEYIQLTPSSRFITRIYLTTDVKNVNDLPAQSSISPLYTSMGDPFLGIDAGQWMFDGIISNTSSSMNPVKNPMLDMTISSGTDTVQHFDYLLGLVWEEIVFTIPNNKIILDSSLHDLCLYHDYQEGDIRVYINGNRQYGNFVEIQSTINPEYIGGIQFNNSVSISLTDIIRIELGEYALSDIGKRAVSVLTPAGTELYNLVTHRKIEQLKTEINQYPQFNIYDIYGNPLTTSSIIFGYKESQDYAINLSVSKRIVYDSSTSNYTFTQYLIGDNEKLFLYKDFAELEYPLQSIWKKGLNNEQYVPYKLDSTTWEMPNQWYYNVNHENTNDISLVELYRHINTIIAAQKTPSIFSVANQSLFYLDDNINYGLGGTIKEHNDNLDLLMSVMFENSVNPINLIQFAHDMYSGNLKVIQEKLQVKAASLLSYNTGINTASDLTAYISEYVKDWFETNEKYDEWFGDSTTYDEINDVGVKNWIATIPYLFLGAKYEPFISYDSVLNIVSVYHHDGHRSIQQYNTAIKEQIYSGLKKLTVVGEQSITSDATPFPTTINSLIVTNGNYLIRTNTSVNTRKLYRYNSVGLWEEINLDVILANIILYFEQSLYNNLPDSSLVDSFVSKYDLTPIYADSAYTDLLKLQYASYIKNNNITLPYSNINIYKSNDPFTWNYAYTPVPVHPVTNSEFTDVAASWQALYTKIYGTPYPHLEPWILQGYSNKPAWWDTYYIDSTGNRKWKELMWNNIFAGIIPIGKETPSFTIGTGLQNQISILFNYVSVNVDSAATLDGVLPDGLLPPYWNTTNTTNVRVRSLYDPKVQEYITTPQANYVFGQESYKEWVWRVASQKLYDDLIIAFKIDPMRFINRTYGIDFVNVACLQVDSSLQKVFSHKDTVFHGDFIENTNTIFKSNGLNQWYTHFNRYNNLGDVSSGFKTLWKDWDVKLSYLFSSFIDTPSFLISNDSFDITTKDYLIDIKKTNGILDKWIDALTGTVLNVPSQYITNRNHSSEWTVQFDNTSRIGRNITFYPPENYDFRMIDNSTGRIYSYDLIDAGIENSYGYQIINYNQTLLAADSTSLVNFAYQFKISIDGAAEDTFIVQGNTAATFGELIDVLNTAFANRATAYIENGNIVIKSNTFGVNSTIALSTTNIGLFESASPNFSGVSLSLQTSIKFLKYFIVDGNKTNTFRPFDNITITNSTNFDGTYSLNNVTYDIATQRTLLYVDQDIVLTNLTVNGILEPSDSKTLPDSWVSGTEIYLNTTGILPTNFDENTAYYVIRINDREFKLADTQDKAVRSVAIVSDSSSGSGFFFVGRVQTNFTAADVNWRRHYSDTRYVEALAPPLVISGIQYMVDFIKGYEDYCTGLGFSFKSVDGENTDNDSGRINTWLLETQKFISSLYKTRSLKTAASQKYLIAADSVNNNFKLLNNYTVNWGIGTQVVLSAGTSSQLPAEFNNPVISFIPYYIIPTIDKNRFQLAASLSDAKNGKAIDITDDGYGDLYASVYQAVTRTPVFEINPFKSYIWVENTLGVLANVLDGSTIDILTNQRIYDNNGNQMTNSDLIVLREDKESRISLTLSSQENNLVSSSPVYMSGMHLFFDGYENILSFNNYATDGTLIFDSFLGLNTPRFYLSFNKQSAYTMRPNVGGYILSDNNLIQNFESSINNLQDLYDPYNNKEGIATTDMMRKSLGYDGPKDYMNSLRINPKSQFIFWKGMIQKKGTNFAVDAFINQSVFDTVEVDEFWAYKVATFGDSKPRDYLDLKLYSTDVSNKELRLEFVSPDSIVVDGLFKHIKLSDMSRWWNQPDQFNKMSPSEQFYFDVNTVEIFNNAESLVTTINGRDVIELSKIANGAIATYFNPSTGVRDTLIYGVDFVLLNSKVLQFILDITNLSDVTVYTVTYNYDAQNPAKLIDKKSNVVISNIPIWNPANAQYYYTASNVIDITKASDPSFYTNYPETSSVAAPSYWAEEKIGTVWFNNTIEGYYPYYDTSIGDINSRMLKYGKLADWADISLYEWVESDVLPSAWDALVSTESSDNTILQSAKKTGSVYKVLYKNNGTVNSPVWVIADQDIHVEYIAGLVESSTLSPSVTNVSVEVYVNGKYDSTTTFATANDFFVYTAALDPQNYIHLVKRAYIPTASDVTNVLYKYDTPYTTITKINNISSQSYNTYYFWVKNKTQKSNKNRLMTIYEAEKLLKTMDEPYMTITGFSQADDSTNLPARFTQCIVKGMAGLISDNDRYSLRFTRDFTLRDNLPTNKMLNDVHVEWKLIRPKQLFKIDEYLWNKLIESLIYKNIQNRTIDDSSQIPSLNRILYDDLYNSDTRFGLADDQVFTDGTISLQTITKILKSSKYDFGNIDIIQFLTDYSFDTINDILLSMYYIYDNFPISIINFIYFQTLYDAMSVKLQSPDFFKTSWVAIQVSQNITTPTTVELNSYLLKEDGICFQGVINESAFNFIPLVEYSIFISSDGLLKYISYSGNEYNVIYQQLLNRVSGSGDITGVWSDGTYIYVTSISGGVDVYYFNGTNFVLISNLALGGTITSVTGYNPILITSYNNEGLGVYSFDGSSLTKLADGAATTIDIKSSTVHNGYIITCGYSRIDAWQYIGGVLNHIDQLTTLTGGANVTSVVSDGTYIYTGSNNNVNMQVFTFNGSNLVQLYTDPIITSGPSVSVGDGYFFTNGSDIRAYEFDGSKFTLIDDLQIGSNYSNLIYSEESKRLYVAGVGIYNFSNNVFQKMYSSPILSGISQVSIIIGDNPIITS